MVEVNPRRGGGQRLIVERVVQDQITGVVIYLPNVLPRAVGKAVDANFNAITRAIYEGMGAGVFPDGPMLRANKEIAHRAQQAILAGWRSRLPVKAAPYRRGSDPKKDRLSGALGEALASQEMTQYTTSRGISFLNTKALAEKARHWYRVNYGAFGVKVGTIRRPKAYPVTVGGHTLFSMQDEMQPAPYSLLPRGGLFTVGEVTYPGRGPADKHGGGHRAALFTDLGFKSVADNVDPVYREMIFAYFRTGGPARQSMQERFDLKGVSLAVTTKGTVKS